MAHCLDHHEFDSPATPTATAALDKAGTNFLSPPLLLPNPPGIELVSSIKNYWIANFIFIISRDLMSETKLLYPRKLPFQ